MHAAQDRLVSPSTSAAPTALAPVQRRPGPRTSPAPGLRQLDGFAAQASFLTPGGGLESALAPTDQVVQREADPAAAPAHDRYAPSPEVAAKFEELRYTEDEAVMTFIVNELLAMGVTARQIEEYATYEQGSGWDAFLALLEKGKFVAFEEDGKEVFRFEVAGDGLSMSGEHGSGKIGKNSQGTGVSAEFEADGHEVAIEAGSTGMATDGGFKDAGAKVTVGHEGGTTTAGATVTRTPGAEQEDGTRTDDGYAGQLAVGHDTGDGVSVSASGGGGVDTSGQAHGSGSVSATVDGHTGTATVSATDQGEAGTDVTASGSYAGGDVAVDAHGRGGGDTVGAGGGASFRAGDVVKVTFRGEWRDAPTTESAGGSVAVDQVDGAAGGNVGYQYGETTGADGKTLVVHTVSFAGREIPLADLDDLTMDLGLSGTIEIAEDGDVAWVASADFEIVSGSHRITFKTAFGEQTVADLNARSTLDFTAGGTRTGDGAFGEVGVTYEGDEVSAAIGGLGMVTDDAWLLGIEGRVTVGDPATAQHSASFAYEAEKSDDWSHYASATYAIVSGKHSGSVTGSVTIQPGDDGYDALWSLHARYGFPVADGHTFVITMGVSADASTTFAWDTSVAWDWEGLLNVKLTGVYKDSDAGEGYGAGIEVKPGGATSPVTLYGGVQNDTNVIDTSQQGTLGSDYDGTYGGVGIKVTW